MRSDAAPSLNQAISPTMTGTWNFTPSANTVPVTINAGVTLTSANMQGWNPETNLDTVVTKDGDVGIGDETPTANLSIRTREADVITPLLPLGWWVADDITGVSDGGLLSATWNDRSGHGNHLTPLGWAGTAGAPTADSSKGPKFRSAGGTGAIASHAAVSLEGTTTGFGSGGVLAFPTDITLPLSGWTVFIIWRDYGSSVTAGSYFLGTNTNLGGSGQDFIRMLGPSDGPNVQNWITQEGAAAKSYSSNFAHVDGNDIEAMVCRSDAGGATSSFWNDGVLIAGSHSSVVTAKILKYIGAHINGSSILACYSKSIVEIGIFNRALTDPEVAIINAYLLNQKAGLATTETPLTHWKDVDGVVDSIVDKSVNFGLGTASPAQKLHVVGKAILQNSSSAFKATLDASSLTADATFDFVDPASSPAIIVTGTGNLNALTIWGAGSGGSVTYTSALNFDGAVGNRQLQIGDAAIATTPGIKIFAQSPYTTTYTLSSTTGVVTFDTPSAGGRYVFTGNTSSEIATFTGGNGIKADKYNRVEITTPTTGSTLTILDTMTVTFDKSLEFDGTSGTKMTFPSTNATIARTDAAQTFTGVQTFSSQDVHTLGIDLSTSGAIVASVANSGTNVGLLVRNTVGLTASRRMFEVDWWTGSAYQEAFGVWSQAGSVKGMQLSYDTSNYLRTTVTSGGSTTILNQGAGSLTFNTSTGNIQFTSAGSIQFSPVTSITFNTLSALLADGLVISNVANVTGLKIGAAADKLGFYSVAPVIQPVNTVAIDTALVNLGLRATGGSANFDTDIKAGVVGNGLYVKEGANATMGIATLVAGVAVVATTKVTANSRIFLTRQTVAGTVGTSVDVTARTAATSFTITAAGSILDTSTVAWLIMEPA